MPMAGKLSVISTAQSAFPKNCGRLFAFLTIVAVKLDFAITFASNSCCFFNRNGNVTVPEPPEVFRNSWQNPQLFRQEQAVSELRVFPKGVHSYCNPRVLSFLYEEQGRIDWKKTSELPLIIIWLTTCDKTPCHSLDKHDFKLWWSYFHFLYFLITSEYVIVFHSHTVFIKFISIKCVRYIK